MKLRLLVLAALPAFALGQTVHDGLTPAQRKKAARVEGEVSAAAKTRLRKDSWQIWPKFSGLKTPDEIERASSQIVSTAYGNLNLGGGDIAALCFIVMMEASEDSQDDLKLIMDETKAITDRKNSLRAQLKALDGETYTPRKRHFNFVSLERKTKTGLTYFKVPPAPGFQGLDGLSKAQLDAEVAEIKNNIDSMSELGEMESLRLQMAMDRMTKLMETLSNLLKKTTDTNSQILQTLKG